MTPRDKDAYYNTPDLFTPKYKEVHISVTFTWDKDKADRLAFAWEKHGRVRIGGIAIDGESDQPFQAGMYLKHGVTITSRGCPNNCWFCLVRRGLIELSKFPEGNIVQDNNFLACSKKHRNRVYDMLRKQKQIEFKGGLDKRLVTPEIADELRSLKIKTLWLACDMPNDIKPLAKAVELLLNAGFKRSHLYCYVLIGKDIQEEESRMREVFKLGAMPFAQLYRDPQDNIKYSKEWKQFARKWSRPAIIRNMCNEGQIAQ